MPTPERTKLSDPERRALWYSWIAKGKANKGMRSFWTSLVKEGRSVE